MDSSDKELPTRREDAPTAPSASSTASTSPAMLSRSALERILARAAELQAVEGDRVDAFTEAQLLEVGREVGLDARNLRQAIAEERAKITVLSDDGRWPSFGSSYVSASRMVRGPLANVVRSLDEWMDKEEVLKVKRRFSESIVWEARRDLVGSVKRSFNFGGRGYPLASAHEVIAGFSPMDDDQVLVHLAANLGAPKRRAVRWGVATSVVGFGSAGAIVSFAALLGGSLIVAGVLGGVAAAFGGGISLAVAAEQRKLAGRCQLALEQALDSLQHKPPSQPNSVLGLLGAAIRR